MTWHIIDFYNYILSSISCYIIMKRSIFALFMLAIFCTSCHDDNKDIGYDADPLIYFLADETTLECVTGEKIDMVIPKQQQSVQLKFVTTTDAHIDMLNNATGISVEFEPGFTFDDKVVYDIDEPYKGIKIKRYLVIVNVKFDADVTPDASAQFMLSYFLETWNPIIRVTRGDTYSMTITERTDIHPTDNDPQQD